MFPEINSIKRKRLLAGLTQKELSKESSISQSTIAKVESGKIEPSYSIVRRLFQALEKASQKDERICAEVMNKKIYFIDSSKKVRDATKIIHKYDISRVPVTSGKDIVGLISENVLLDNLATGIDYEKLLDKQISEVMENPIPMVNLDFSVKNIIPLVKESGAILVLDRGRPVGIISKSDLI